jgi:hypothetical protein
MEAGVAITLASLLLGATGLWVTIRTNLSRAERDELIDYRRRMPELLKVVEEKDRVIDGYKAENLRLYQRLAGIPPN